jgi:hypothetical protein
MTIEKKNNMKKIIFGTQLPWINKDSNSAPKPIIKTLPEWYRKADRFHKDPVTETYAIGPDKGKIPTYKSCPAMFDVMGTGYSLLTPCDLEFFNKNGVPTVRIQDSKYSNFCTPRSPMPQFITPTGYYDNHFAWFPDWSVESPEGYSVLYVSPLNRFELPFLTVSGIIDNDKVNLPGAMPFFLKLGFEGVIPAGTPYMQLIPFKRDNWESEYLENDSLSIITKSNENGKRYRVKNGGVYKNSVWQKRSYE